MSNTLSYACHYINDKSELMTFGDSENNTTGLGYSGNHYLITPERILQNMKLVNSSRRIHLAVNNNGDLYSWASSKLNFLLGRIVQHSGSPNNAYKLPGKVHNIEPIKYVGRPGTNNFIVVGESGRAYGAGANMASELALGHDKAAYVDSGKRVGELVEVAKGVRWKKIDFFHNNLAIGISEDDYAYTWGGGTSNTDLTRVYASSNSFIYYEEEYNKEYTMYRKSGTSLKVSKMLHVPTLISNEKVKKVEYAKNGIFIILTQDGRLLTKSSIWHYDIPEYVDVVKSGIKKDMAYKERPMSRNMRFNDFLMSKSHYYVFAIERNSKKLYSFYNGALNFASLSYHGIDFTKEEIKEQAHLIKQLVGEPWIEIGNGEKFEQLDDGLDAYYALSSKGQMYGWGRSDEGRLANLNPGILIPVPTLLYNVKGPKKLRGYTDEIVVSDEAEKDIVHMINVPLYKDFRNILSKYGDIENNENIVKLQYMAGVALTNSSTQTINAIVRTPSGSLSRKKVNILGNYSDSEPLNSFIETLNAIKNNSLSTGTRKEYVTVYVTCRVKVSFEDKIRKMFNIIFESDERSLTASGFGYSKIEEWRIDG